MSGLGLLQRCGVLAQQSQHLLRRGLCGGMVGKGKVKSFSEDKQYANVVFDDGREVPILTNGLYLVGKG